MRLLTSLATVPLAESCSSSFPSVGSAVVRFNSFTRGECSPFSATKYAASLSVIVDFNFYRQLSEKERAERGGGGRDLKLSLLCLSFRDLSKGSPAILRELPLDLVGPKDAMRLEGGKGRPLVLHFFRFLDSLLFRLSLFLEIHIEITSQQSDLKQLSEEQRQQEIKNRYRSATESISPLQGDCFARCSIALWHEFFAQEMLENLCDCGNRHRYCRGNTSQI